MLETVAAVVAIALLGVVVVGAIAGGLIVLILLADLLRELK